MSLAWVLAFFLLLGLAQVAFAGRVVDFIHGGPGRRGPKGRSLDVLVLRAAGGFVAVLAAIVLAVVTATGAAI